MKRTHLAALALLAGCSFAPIRVPVDDLTLPANSSAGLICYVPAPITEQLPANFRSADYRADATYTSVGQNPVTVTVYGRTSAPASPCVVPGADDVQLSSALTLTPGTTQPVLIGGPDYGEELADLLTADSYYLGASLDGGTLLSASERITLTGGEVSVSF